MSEETAALHLELDPGQQVDMETLDELAVKLRRDLLTLDVHGVHRPSAGEAPEGTRGMEAAAIGALIVETARSAGALTGVISKIREWLSRDSERRARITIGKDTLEMSGLNQQDQEALIRDWIARHSSS